MKFGIYYAFWEHDWNADYIPYVRKVKDLGFDILEISGAGLSERSDEYMRTLRDTAKDNNIILTCGYGPRPQDNIAVENRKEALSFYNTLFSKLEVADIHLIGGGLYSYWPIDYSKPFDKKRDLDLSIAGMKEMADIAMDHGIDLGMEVLNRFEGYLLNTAEEAVSFVKAVDRKNVHVMLDTFHMNIEEDSFTKAIETAGALLGHFHIGQPNRKLPQKGRMDWNEIGKALRSIGYDGTVVMEPFIRMGGQIGQDIKVFHDLTEGMSDEEIDRKTAESVEYIRNCFNGK